MIWSLSFCFGRGAALGWLAASIAVGRATGPNLGGILVHLRGWRAVCAPTFRLGIPVSIAFLRVLRRREERK